MKRSWQSWFDRKFSSHKKATADPVVLRNVIDEIETWRAFAFLSGDLDQKARPNPVAAFKEIQSRNVIHHLMQRMQNKSAGLVGRYIRVIGGQENMHPHFHIVVECDLVNGRGEIPPLVMRSAAKYFSEYGNLDYKPGSLSRQDIRRVADYLACHREEREWFRWIEDHVGHRVYAVRGSKKRVSPSIPAVRPLRDPRVRRKAS